MYIKGGLAVGIYYSVGQKCPTFAGLTNTLRSKEQKRVLVHLDNPGPYTQVCVLC